MALVAHWDWVLFNFRLPIAKRLRDIGYDVVLVCPPGSYVDRLREEGFRIVPWRVERRSFHPVRERASISELIRIYSHERPDVAHHFTIKPNLYGTLAARRTRVPIVINTFSGMGFLLSEGRRASALRLAITPVMKATFRSRSVWTVFQNEEDLASAVDRGFVAEDRTTLIAGSGVDVDRYSPRTGSCPPRSPVFLMAARLIREKGVQDFVAAAGVVARSGTSARFVVAGEPDHGNPSSLSDSQIDAWRRDTSVEFLGHISDMTTLLAEADAAVLPTYYPEGLPKFLLEAAASGLPLIATDIPPCRPVVQDGYNGYLVPPRDPDALAEAIARLANDQDLRHKLGQNGRRLVEERFREQDVVDQYIRLYDQLLSGGA